jgi:heterodisulfide reductase subunit B
MMLDKLIQATGAEAVDFDFKTKCCGGYLVVTQPDVAVKCVRRIVDNARDCGADLMTATCPLCHYNVDALQQELMKQDPKFKPVPILYFPKLVGLALGMPAEGLAFDYGKVDARPVLKARGLLPG